METYQIQVRLGNLFEDLLIEASSVEAAIEIAKEITTLKHHFARFIA